MPPKTAAPRIASPAIAPPPRAEEWPAPVPAPEGEGNPVGVADGGEDGVGENGCGA